MRWASHLGSRSFSRLGVVRKMTQDITDDVARGPSSESGDGYVVVARRYRPQTFEELVGQEPVARALANAIKAGRVGHAYLFTGARGVGKTSAARILAKALNCVQGPTPTPCNQCDICQSISRGDDVDVLEIDGASNRGIDEIRELRQNVNVRPARARSKIYIIDEVHMLTREAFNALLKTLEEPPEHVKFIFCTTEAEKIPITILSRCQRFDFSGIHLPEIVSRLRQIVEGENVEAEEEALQLLARRAAGSMRDSQSLLEQLLSFCGDKITAADVHSMLGTAAGNRVADLLNKLTPGRTAEVLDELDAAAAEGVDLGQLVVQVLSALRDIMVLKVGCKADTLLGTSTADREELEKLAANMSLDRVLAAMQILDHTLGRMRFSTHVRVLVEMALVQISRLEEIESISSALGRLSSAAPAAPQSPAAATTAQKKTDEPVASARAEQPGQEAPEVEPSAEETPVEVISLTEESAREVWRKVLETLSDLTADYARLGQSVKLAAHDRLLVGFPKTYTSAKEICERPEQSSKLNQALSRVAGRNVRVDFEVLSDEGAPPPSSQPQRRSGASRRQLMQEAEQNPMVQKAKELFGAELTAVEEPGSDTNRNG